MTTITTTQPLPTPSLATPRSGQIWRLVATFVAGVVLAGGAAAGINAMSDDSSPAPSPRSVSSSSAVRLPACPAHGANAC